jgi:large subunit ribosomal protein L27
MAHTKSGGSTTLGRDSASKRLGIKRSDGTHVHTGMILIRQRGTSVHPGINVRRGADDTIFSMTSGTVHFRQRKVRAFHGALTRRTFVDVIPVHSSQ